MTLNTNEVEGNRSACRVYIAAPLAMARQAYRLGQRLALFDRGIEIVSRWAENCVVQEVRSDPLGREHRRAILRDNIADLERADVVVALTHDGIPRATAGDVAWALAREKPVVWVCGRGGEGRNIWDAHALVTLLPINDLLRGFLDIWAAVVKAGPFEDSGASHRSRVS